MNPPSNYNSKKASELYNSKKIASKPQRITHKQYHKPQRKPQQPPKAPPYKYDMLQLLFLVTHYETTNEYYIEEFPLYTVPHYITRKKHPSHDNYLYRRWNNPTARSKKTRKTKRRILAHSNTKDDPSVTVCCYCHHVCVVCLCAFRFSFCTGDVYVDFSTACV